MIQEKCSKVRFSYGDYYRYGITPRRENKVFLHRDEADLQDQIKNYGKNRFLPLNAKAITEPKAITHPKEFFWNSLRFVGSGGFIGVSFYDTSCFPNEPSYDFFHSGDAGRRLSDLGIESKKLRSKNGVKYYDMIVRPKDYALWLAAAIVCPDIFEFKEHIKLNPRGWPVYQDDFRWNGKTAAWIRVTSFHYLQSIKTDENLRQSWGGLSDEKIDKKIEFFDFVFESFCEFAGLDSEVIKSESRKLFSLIKRHETVTTRKVVIEKKVLKVKKKEIFV